MTPLPPERHHRLILALYLLALFAVTLVGNWHYIGHPHHELGDFAANSTLMQVAQKMELLTGHYSRLGIYHPGPIWLYTMGWGEWLLVDALHWSPSGLSAQFVVVLALAMVELGVLAFQLRQLLGQARPAFLALFLMVAISAAISYQFFASVWYPHLILFPFAIFVLAAVQTVLGDTRQLVLLATITGILIHGHVSFLYIGMLGLAAVIALNALAGLLGWLTPDHHVLQSAFWRLNQRKVMLAGAIGALFAAPMALETWVNFPGPLADYYRYKTSDYAASINHTWPEMRIYMGLHWWPHSARGLILLPLTTLALGFLALKQASGLKRHLLALVTMIWTMSLIVKQYAQHAIDFFPIDVNVDMYVTLFYFSVPILTYSVLGTLLVMQVVRWSRPSQPLPLTGLFVVAVASLATVAQAIHRPNEFDPHYSWPAMPAFYQQLRQIHPGPIALSLEEQSGGMDVVARVTGLLAYATRHGDWSICIERAWRHEYTRQLKCREPLPPGTRSLVLRGVEEKNTYGQVRLGQRDGLAIDQGSSPKLASHTRYQPSAHPALFENYIFRSVRPLLIEPDRVWITQQTLDLWLPAAPDGAAQAWLEISGFLPKATSTQQLTVTYQGRTLAQCQLSQTTPRVQCPIDLRALGHQANGYDLQIRAQSLVSPQQAGVSEDKRPLAFALHALTFDSNTPAMTAP